MADRTIVVITVLCVISFTNSLTETQGDIQHRLDALERTLLYRNDELSMLINGLLEETVKFDHQNDKLSDTAEVVANETVVGGTSRDHLLVCLGAVERLKGIRNRLVKSDRETVAFTAYIDDGLAFYISGEPMIYNQVLINEGSGYSNETGIFTCTKAGVYMFYFSIKQSGWLSMYHDLYAKLMVNTGEVSSTAAVTINPDQHMQGSNFAIVRLDTGDEVWVLPDGQLDLDSAATSFSGVKIGT